MSATSVIKEIVVHASQERAFRVFTDGIDTWWPKEHHIGSSPSKQEIIEPRVGGRWYSIDQDGSETNVGKVLAWAPFERIVLAWQVTASWQYDPDFVTEVEVRFIAKGPKVTQVVLEHRHLDRFGKDAENLRKMFSSDDGWSKTLREYAKAADQA